MIGTNCDVIDLLGPAACSNLLQESLHLTLVGRLQTAWLGDDFAHQLEYEDLTKDARTVLADLAPVRRELHSRKDRWYDVRMRPYRTVDDKIDGVVITFVDVTDRRKVEEALRLREAQLQELAKMDRAPKKK